MFTENSLRQDAASVKRKAALAAFLFALRSKSDDIRLKHSRGQKYLLLRHHTEGMTGQCFAEESDPDSWAASMNPAVMIPVGIATRHIPRSVMMIAISLPKNVTG